MEDEVLMRITPDKAMELLQRDGIYVNLEEAQIIIDFLYSMANIVVEQFVSSKQSDAMTITNDNK
ncbi:hypothetical protein BCY91_06050 [Pelobium manganitolerans]|uniref:Uncharacterized protein n=1 Tax=Pelobium manganitolerans TaxID=1842495 RepID=A0A419S4Q3_9SPHI|nr:hypothetical protein [Pelobium manganitolerans]RKD15085.1 hypothetical protein BCY91_06050 [Pelobium manganitolerans]